MKVRSGLLALLFAAIPLGACGAILGIEQLPIDDGLDASPDQEAEASPPADAGCEASSRMCGCVPHDFCDDFDVDGEALGARWKNDLGIPNPFTKADASMELSNEGLSPPRALLTRTGDEKSSSFALLSHQLVYDASYPGRAFAGFRYTADIRVEKIVTTEPRGPLREAGSAAAASVLHYEGLVVSGIVLLVVPDGAYLLTAASILDNNGVDGGNGDLVRLFDGDILELSKSWIRVELLIAEKGRALREGFPTCAAVADGFVAAAAVGPAGAKQGCLAIPPDVGVAWAAEPVVQAGGLLFAGGELVLRQDNIAFDFLAP